ncbi:MAG: helix-turn-helix transcriptional regulator [Labilithrix sp.]|nr:helix-turn-helix transcriptional regulator [Labilithrix sp.]MCW5830907.1 helix-turn-helix transcriptional regulator [Labilithrix sp.]
MNDTLGPSAADLYRVLEKAASLGAAETSEDLVERTLAAMWDLIPGLSVSWNELDLAAGIIRAVIRPDPGAEWYETQRPVFARLMGQNPFVAHVERTADTRALRWDDVAPPGAILRTELYAQFYAPLGIESQLAVALPAPPGVMIGLAVNRGAEGFSERERALLGLLRPHIVNAYRYVCHRLEAAALRTVATKKGWQVLLVDGTATILDRSRTFADTSLAIGKPLPSTLAEPLERAVRLLANERVAAPSDPVRLRLDDGALQAWMVGSELGPHVVVLRDEVRPPVEKLGALGLSPREVEVALALADGGSNERLAQRLGIAIGTVRKHLERVYTILDVSDRTSAAARVRALAFGDDDDESTKA